jgi:hypothetical protein
VTNRKRVIAIASRMDMQFNHQRRADLITQSSRDCAGLSLLDQASRFTASSTTISPVRCKRVDAIRHSAPVCTSTQTSIRFSSALANLVAASANCWHVRPVLGMVLRLSFAALVSVRPKMRSDHRNH